MTLLVEPPKVTSASAKPTAGVTVGSNLPMSRLVVEAETL